MCERVLHGGGKRFVYVRVAMLMMGRRGEEWNTVILSIFHSMR